MAGHFEEGTRPSTVAAWDLPTRLFHWSLVVLIAAAWASMEFSGALGDPLLKWHRNIGLAVLVLLVWRVLWGFAGSSTARFASFVSAPLSAPGYAAALLRGSPRKYLGHNPLGTVMVIALLGLLLVQAGLGLFTVEHNDLTAGPLYRFVDEAAQKDISRWHRWLFETVTVIFVGAHVLANVVYSVFLKQPLIRAMVTGRKPADTYVDETQAEVVARPMVRAAVCLVISAVLVIGGIWAVGGKFL